MAFQFDNALYPDFLNELINFKLDSDYNQTCNVILSKNQTLIEIDRGWEGIPETLVINLVLCFVSFLKSHFYIIIKQLFF